MNIIYVGSFAVGPGHPLSDDERFARALERAGTYVHRCDFPWLKAEKQVAAVRPEWVLFSKVRGLDPQRVARIRGAAPGVRLAQILFDLMDYNDRTFRGIPLLKTSRLTWWLPVAKQMNIVFLRERGHLERYASAGVHGYYLDQACDSEESPAEVAPGWARCDLAFFGTYLPQRARVLRRLSRGRRLIIYSDNPTRWLWGGLIARPPTWGPRLAEAVMGAAVVYGESARNDVRGYWSDRVYRVLGHRGFFLTRYVPGLEAFFTNHEHLVWGDNDSEIEALFARYVEDPAERQRIAEAGFKHVRAHHTYDHRAREMLGVLARTS